MKKALKETLRIMLRALLGVGIGVGFTLLFLPDIRAYMLAEPWPIIMGTVQIIAIFSVLILAAQLVLVWVRAEKKEEETP